MSLNITKHKFFAARYESHRKKCDRQCFTTALMWMQVVTMGGNMFPLVFPFAKCKLKLGIDDSRLRAPNQMSPKPTRWSHHMHQPPLPVDCEGPRMVLHVTCQPYRLRLRACRCITAKRQCDGTILVADAHTHTHTHTRTHIQLVVQTQERKATHANQNAF